MTRTTGILVITLLFCLGVSNAQIPRTLSYQGLLADSSGAPKPDGTYNLTFHLYSVSSGGPALWTETQSAQAKHGLFSAILGSVNPIPDSVRFDQQYWLGIVVDSDPEFVPRLKLSSVGSSFSSIRADTAQNIPDNSITEGKIENGQVVKSINNLHDHLTMRGANGASVTANGDTITITASGGGGGGIGTVQNTDNALSVTNPSGPTTTINLQSPFTINGNVGIGTTAPGYMLNVGNWTTANGSGNGQGVIVAEGNEAFIGWGDRSLQSADRNKRWGWFATGGKTYLWDNNAFGSRIAVDGTSGNVGIGTTTPNHRLRISGGPSWTSSGWLGALEFDNASAMAWRTNNAGNRFGIGVSTGGLFFFRTLSDPGTTGSPPTYDMTINDNGNVGIGTLSPGGKLQVNGGSGFGILAYSDVSVALGGVSAGYGINGVTTGDNAAGVLGTSSGTSSPGVRGNATGSSTAGVFGFSTAPNSVGVQGSGGSSSNPGVLGQSNSGIGVWGSSTSWRGVYGQSNSNAGVLGVSENFDGVFGESHSSSAAGVSGHNTAGGFAGYFIGNVVVTGTLSKGGGAFKIDHPLDPENKYLYHSFVESPDMMDIYNGLVTLDGNGEAVVALPDWFDALNKDFRYQLTAVGAPAPNLYIAQEISGNQFRIAGGSAGNKVSWQVTGIRKDAFAERHRIPVEEMKSAKERGFYLHPDAFGQPPEKGVEWANHPELMKKHDETPLPGLADGKETPRLQIPNGK